MNIQNLNILSLTIVIIYLIQLIYQNIYTYIDYVYLLVIILFFSLLLLTSKDLINFYFVFEIINILIYILLNINTKFIKTYKANIIYLLVGFGSSLLFLIGILFIFINQTNLYINQYSIMSLIGFICINTALFIKLGIFPYQF